MLGVQVFHATIDAVTSALRERYSSWLTDDERRASARMAAPLLRDEYLVARALSRWVLSQIEPAVAPEAWQFSRTEAGRPIVVGPRSVPSWNLSHAGGHVVCAVSAHDVGVDVEPSARGGEILLSAGKMFSAAENTALDALPEAERAGRALHLWTLKEAYLKARGHGITVRPARVSIAAEKNGRYRLGDVSVLGDTPDDWQLDLSEPHEEVAGQARPCAIAVAVRSGRVAPLPVSYRRVVPA